MPYSHLYLNTFEHPLPNIPHRAYWHEVYATLGLTFVSFIFLLSLRLLYLSRRGENSGRHFDLCAYLSPEVMVNLTKNVAGHFVTFIQIDLHHVECNIYAALPMREGQTTI